MNDYEPNRGSDMPSRPGGMATVSIILGIIAILACIIFYLAIPLGALGILLALLSRGKHKRMATQAKIGLTLSLVSILLSASLTTYTVYTYRDLFISGDFQQLLDDYMEYYYQGEENAPSSQDILDEFFSDDEEDSSEEELPGDDFFTIPDEPSQDVSVPGSV